MTNLAQDTAPQAGATPTIREIANAIRALSMDAVEAANSGHPGMPMGMADVATVLFTKFLKFDASAPDAPDFVPVPTAAEYFLAPSPKGRGLG